MVRVMPSIENEYRNSRIFYGSLFKSISCSSSYQKLPRHLINLSILKLDGSSFDVSVDRNATVAELRQAVEGVFSSSPKDGEADISWSGVWGYFCLCHEDHKLLDDKVQIRNLGINDGYQLKFIQHMSINYSPTKQRSQKTRTHSMHLYRSSLLKKSAYGKEKQTITGDATNIIEDEPNFCSRVCDDEEDIHAPKFKLTRSLNSRLTYTKLKRSTRKQLVGRDRSWKF